MISLCWAQIGDDLVDDREDGGPAAIDHALAADLDDVGVGKDGQGRLRGPSGRGAPRQSASRERVLPRAASGSDLARSPPFRLRLPQATAVGRYRWRSARGTPWPVKIAELARPSPEAPPGCPRALPDRSGPNPCAKVIPSRRSSPPVSFRRSIRRRSAGPGIHRRGGNRSMTRRVPASPCRAEMPAAASSSCRRRRRRSVMLSRSRTTRPRMSSPAGRQTRIVSRTT